ncbi:MAG: hypothetical protein MJE77_01340 [Proteobacteria bacterium]|nr:hypothetical protein [Pseudomonadota bacterium]
MSNSPCHGEPGTEPDIEPLTGSDADSDEIADAIEITAASRSGADLLRRAETRL